MSGVCACMCVCMCACVYRYQEGMNVVIDHHLATFPWPLHLGWLSWVVLVNEITIGLFRAVLAVDWYWQDRR